MQNFPLSCCTQALHRVIATARPKRPTNVKILPRNRLNLAFGQGKEIALVVVEANDSKRALGGRVLDVHHRFAIDRELRILIHALDCELANVVAFGRSEVKIERIGRKFIVAVATRIDDILAKGCREIVVAPVIDELLDNLGAVSACREDIGVAQAVRDKHHAFFVIDEMRLDIDSGVFRELRELLLRNVIEKDIGLRLWRHREQNLLAIFADVGNREHALRIENLLVGFGLRYFV